MKFDPYSAEFRSDPYPVLKTLRDEHPAYFSDELGSWVLSRYEDVENALQDPDTFSSAGAIAIGAPDEVMASLPMMILLDPPRHTKLRALVNRAFTPRRVAELEPQMRKLATEYADDLLANPEFDLVRDYSGPIPTTVIATLLGVPSEDHRMFRENTTAVVTQNPRAEEIDLTPAITLAGYIGGIYEARRASPKDDLMSALLSAEVEGEKLDQQELVAFGLQLLIAGTETTTNLISNAIELFHRYPGSLSQLRENADLLPDAIEEVLRFESPVQALSRTLRRRVELHGQVLEEGQRVLLLYGSANRDERRIEEPQKFDIRKPAARHLAFGLGTHFCLGASLARLEGRIALEELLKRLPSYEVDFDRSERLGGGVVRGWRRLGVRLVA